MSIADLTGEPTRPQVRPPTARGKVAETPSGEHLRVLLPTFSTRQHFEVPADQWTSAAGAPAAGDDCLVVFDDEGDAWAIIGGSGSGGGSGAPEVWIDPAQPVPRQQYSIWVDTDEVSLQWPPARVTSLPVSPADGTEVYFVADAAGGVVWHLRFNAASASVYKWEVVGSSPLWAESTALVSTASTAYVSAGPAITVPLSGEYMVRSGAAIEAGLTSGWRGRASFAGNDAESVMVSGTGVAGGASSGASTERIVRRILVGGTNFNMVIKSDAGNNITTFNRYLEFTPVRVG